MLRFRNKKYFSDSKIYGIIISVISGLIVIALCLLGFAYVIKMIGSGSDFTSALANIALVAGCMTAGYCAARHKSRDGLKIGICVGLIIFAIVYILGVFIIKNFIGLTLLTKIVIIVIAASIGGILGVNSRIRPRRK